MTERTWFRNHTDRVALTKLVDKIVHGPSFAGNIVSEIFCENRDMGFKLMSRQSDSDTILVALQVLQEDND